MVTETKIAKVDKRKLVIIDIEQFYDEVMGLGIRE